MSGAIKVESVHSVYTVLIHFHLLILVVLSVFGDNTMSLTTLICVLFPSRRLQPDQIEKVFVKVFVVSEIIIGWILTWISSLVLLVIRFLVLLVILSLRLLAVFFLVLFLNWLWAITDIVCLQDR